MPVKKKKKLKDTVCTIITITTNYLTGQLHNSLGFKTASQNFLQQVTSVLRTDANYYINPCFRRKQLINMMTTKKTSMVIRSIWEEHKRNCMEATPRTIVPIGKHLALLLPVIDVDRSARSHPRSASSQMVHLDRVLLRQRNGRQPVDYWASYPSISDIETTDTRKQRTHQVCTIPLRLWLLVNNQHSF